MDNIIFFPQAYSDGIIQDCLTNAIFYWKHLPKYDFISLFIIFTSLFILGTFLYFRKSFSFFKSLLSSLLIPATTILLFGIDLVIIQLLSFIPWFLYFSNNLNSKYKRLSFICLLILTLIAGHFTNHFFIIIGFFLFFIFDIFQNQNQKKVFSFLFIGIVLFTIQKYQIYQIDNLPDGYEYVPEKYNTNTLALENINQPILFLKNFFENYKLVIYVLLLFNLIQLAYSKNKSHFLLFVISLLLALESFNFSKDYLPLTALTNIIAGLNTTHFFTILLAFLCFSTIILSKTEVLLTILLLVLTSQSNSSWKNNYQNFSRLPDPNNLAKSYHLNTSSNNTWVYANELISVKFNNNKIDFNNLIDQNTKTRISGFTGKQTGNEKVEFIFSQPISLKGIDISVGDYTSDYPRGLNIYYSSDCLGNNYQKIIERKNWYGGHHELNKKLYFGHPTNMKIIFPEQISACKLVLHQSSTGIPFDWSIAELKIVY